MEILFLLNLYCAYIVQTGKIAADVSAKAFCTQEPLPLVANR